MTDHQLLALHEKLDEILTLLKAGRVSDTYTKDHLPPGCTDVREFYKWCRANKTQALKVGRGWTCSRENWEKGHRAPETITVEEELYRAGFRKR